VIEETERIQSNPFHQRRLTRVRAELSRALAASDPPRARQLANLAIAWYRQAGGYEQAIEQLSQLADPQP
jgi:hypothetical protein